jgi:S1-C subfamily serine protease
VKWLFSIAIALCAATAALGRSAPSLPPHPAVVRVIVPERNGASLGSGSLVAVSQRYGLVVTNHHVVRDGNGQVGVVFPDGFRSGATVVRVDRDWDLAALVIWRPNARPISLANEVPRLGEPLSIAGYGSGDYRLVTGRCSQYVSPGGNLPYEMIELSAGARQGDSGGPILNQRGELAGVLFGASWGRTVGSHCLRARQFLDPIIADFERLSGGDPTMIAQQPAPAATAPAAQPEQPRPPTVTIPSGSRPGSETNALPNNPSGGWAASPVSRGSWTPPEMPSAEGVAESPPQAVAGPSLIDQAKTVLAVIGLLAIFLQVIRWLGAG